MKREVFFFFPSSPKPCAVRVRVVWLGRLKTHLLVGSGRMWKVMQGGTSSALGLGAVFWG